VVIFTKKGPITDVVHDVWGTVTASLTNWLNHVTASSCLHHSHLGIHVMYRCVSVWLARVYTHSIIDLYMPSSNATNRTVCLTFTYTILLEHMAYSILLALWL